MINRALIFVYIFDFILLLLPLISTVAFTSIVGITTIGFQVSYGIPILLKLIFNYNTFPQTEFSLKNYSNICNIISCFWLFGTSMLLFMPNTYPITYKSMNYTIFVVLSFIIISYFYWIFYAKYNFRGPLRTKNDMIHINDEIIVHNVIIDMKINDLNDRNIMNTQINNNNNNNNSNNNKNFEYKYKQMQMNTNPNT